MRVAGTLDELGVREGERGSERERERGGARGEGEEEELALQRVELPGKLAGEGVRKRERERERKRESAQRREEGGPRARFMDSGSVAATEARSGKAAGAAEAGRGGRGRRVAARHAETTTDRAGPPVGDSERRRQGRADVGPDWAKTGRRGWERKERRGWAEWCIGQVQAMGGNDIVLPAGVMPWDVQVPEAPWDNDPVDRTVRQSLWSQVVFQSTVSIATLGLYPLPIFFRVTTARRSFVPGPFHLERYGVAVGWVAIGWVALVTVLFSLPVAYPVVKENFNYAPVAVGGVLLLSVGTWVLHARFWFPGPVTNVDM
ncbi:hypothetical protein EJB05_06490, partial [Eragrostis curvula]